MSIRVCDYEKFTTMNTLLRESIPKFPVVRRQPKTVIYRCMVVPSQCCSHPRQNGMLSQGIRLQHGSYYHLGYKHDGELGLEMFENLPLTTA